MNSEKDWKFEIEDIAQAFEIFWTQERLVRNKHWNIFFQKNIYNS